jgi:ankyrin repeat protein
LIAAIERSDPDLVRCLVATADPNKRCAGGGGPLHALPHLRRNDDARLQIADCLVDAGADLASADDWGVTAVGKACGMNDHDLARRLVAACRAEGIDPHRPDLLGLTPLHLACHTGADPQVAALLIQDGADVDAKDSAGRTPLSLAVMAGAHETTAWLLAKGAGPEGARTALRTMDPRLTSSPWFTATRAVLNAHGVETP